MRVFLSILAILFNCLSVFSQPPQSFKYQGIARNGNGNPLSSRAITLRISIHQGSPAGTTYFKEIYNTFTNEFGGFSITIGTGTPASGSNPLSAMPWGQSNFFQETELDTAGGTNFVSMGTSQLLSVPYALYAGNGGFSHYQVFDASDTFRVPQGVTRIMVELWGAGGGGGGGGGGSINASNGGTGGGGGGGGYIKDLLNVNSGEAIAVIIGHRGLGGIGGNAGGLSFPGGPGSSGSTGNSTSFKNSIVNGGSGGNGGTGGSATAGINGQGGNGGSGGNAPGNLGIVGQFGYPGQYGGMGGNAGGGGGFGGNPGGDKRAGGAGSGGVGQPGNGNPGTEGGDGRVIVWW